MFLLSGCGAETTAKNVVDALKEEDYDEAKEIFNDAVYESEDPFTIHETTSKAIQGYLNDMYSIAYNRIDDGDYSKEEEFYYLLSNVEDIGIDDEELNDEIAEYRYLLVGDYDSEDSEDSYVDEENYDDEEYAEEDEYNEDEEVASDNQYTATSIDHDCPDFATQEDAQLFFEANGGPEYDPHDLDRDNDGMACDWNP